MDKTLLITYNCVTRGGMEWNVNWSLEMNHKHRQFFYQRLSCIELKMHFELHSINLNLHFYLYFVIVQELW